MNVDCFLSHSNLSIHTLKVFQKHPLDTPRLPAFLTCLHHKAWLNRPIKPLLALYSNVQKLFKYLTHYHACGGPEIREDVRAFYGMWGLARLFLALGRATRNLQTGKNKDIRYVMCELGFTGAFFQMMLNVTKTDERRGAVNEVAGSSAQAKL